MSSTLAIVKARHLAPILARDEAIFRTQALLMEQGLLTTKD